MRVVYLLDYPISMIGGAQLSTLSMGNILDKVFGAEIYYICPYDNSTLALKNTMGEKKNVIFLHSVRDYIKAPYKSPLQFLHVLKELQEAIYVVKPDIVHSQMPTSFIVNSLLRENNKLVKVHTDRSVYDRYRYPMRILNRSFAKYVDCIITTTNYNASKWELAHPRQLEVIPNFVSDAFLEYKESYKKYLRKLYNIGNTLAIGFAGRMTNVKNWPLAYEIIKELNTKRKDFFVILALSVNKSVYREVKLAEEFISALENVMKDRLIVFRDANQQKMSDFYYLVDVFILTSKFESFGRTAIEAMSRKCCVLGTNVGGLPEVINDVDLICKPDLDDFISRITWLLDNQSVLEDKKKSLYKNFTQNFDPLCVSKKQYNLYTKLLEEHK